MSDEVKKTIILPPKMWLAIEALVKREDTDFSKWSRRAFRRQLEEDADESNRQESEPVGA